MAGPLDFVTNGASLKSMASNLLPASSGLIGGVVGTVTGGTSLTSLASGLMPQMVIGNYLFSLNMATYQELDRSTSHRWAMQERFNQPPAYQYLGVGEETISLHGIVYPGYRGGTGQLDKLRALAAQGKPQLLLDGHGTVYGRWIIEQIDEKQSNIAALGVPRKQEFTMRLKHFDGGSFNAVAKLLDGKLGGQISDVVNKVNGAVSSAITKVESAIGIGA